MIVEDLELTWDLYFLPNEPKEVIDKYLEGWDDAPAPEPLSLIPPYDLKSENNTALMAQSIKIWYPKRSVGIVMPNVRPSRLCQLVRTFRTAGFSPIVFHGLQLYNVARLKNHLHQEQWYHVCDPDFEIPYEGVKGKWTRSEKL